jgi:hypothetical protein
MNFDMMNILRMIRGGANPQQLMLQYLQGEFSRTPMGANLLSLAQRGDAAGIEQVARNVCTQRGVDFDEEFNSFKQQLGVK